jgi:hypothetical protein
VPVVEKHEPVMLAQCPLCQGSTLYVIERFVTLEDRRDFADQEKRGYSIKRMTLQQAGSIGECPCTETALARHMDKKRVVTDRPRKPVLTLGRR